MIAKGNTHDNGVRLARYLTTGKQEEYVELWELRGFASRDITEAFRTVEVIAKGGQCTHPFFHVQVRNPEGETLARFQWESVADRIERMLGLRDQPRAIAVHIDRRTGHEHLHIAFSRIDEETLKAKPLPFYKLRLKKASRELEIELGLTAVKNERDGPVKYAPTRREDAQARRLGVDVHQVRKIIHDCYERSDCGRSFQTALVLEHLILARGDRRDFLVVDREGGMHAIGRRILGVSAAEIRRHLADLSPDSLPTLDQARKSIIEQQRVVPRVKTGCELRSAVGESKGMNKAETADRRLRLKHGRTQGEEEGRRIVPPDPPAPSLSCPLDQAKMELSPLGIPAHPESSAANAADRSGSSEPAGEPAFKPPSGFAAALRQQFRALVKHLTGREAAPTVKSRRRREESRGGFNAAALMLLRRFRGVLPFQPFNPSWEPFTWLHLWEYNDPASFTFHEDSAAPPPSSSHAPHL